MNDASYKNWARALTFAVGTTLLWFATETVFSTLRGYSIVQIVWTRYGIHLVCMLILLGPRQAFRQLSTARPGLQMGRGVLMILMPILGAAGLVATNPAGFRVAFWLFPLMIVAAAPFLSFQRIHLRQWVVCTAAYVGLLCIVHPGFHDFNPQILLALGSGASFSLYVVLTHRLQETDSLGTNLLYTALVVIGPLSLALPSYWRTPSLVDLIKMVLVGIAGLATLWCLEKALECGRPADLAPVLFLPAIWGVLARWFLYGVRPDLMAVMGILIVLTSLLAHHLMAKKQT